MNAQVPRRGFVTRPYQPDDEEQVLRLLARTLPGWAHARSDRAKLWRWKHFLNPFGISHIQVAYAEGAGVVGLHVLMRWRLRRRDRIIRATRGVDLATHPDYRGLGIATSLVRDLGEEVRDRSITFNMPSYASFRIALRAGRQFIGVIGPSIRVRHVARLLLKRVGLHMGVPPGPDFASDVASQALPVQSWLDHRDEVEDLLEKDGRVDRFRTERTPEYLRWRYVDHPIEKYYVLNVEEGTTLLGSVIFRVSSGATANGIIVQETFMRRRDPRIVLALGRRLQEFQRADYLLGYVSHDPLERAVLGRRGVFRLPKSGYKLTVDVFDAEFAEATRLSAWGLTIGDLEGF